MMAISSFASLGSSTTTPRLCRITQISCQATNNKYLPTNPRTYSNPFRYLQKYNEEYLSIKHTEKIMNVRHMLEAEEEEEEKQPLKCMVMVDALQRLGIDYHFQEQIQAQLSRLHVTTGGRNSIYESQDLDLVSLCFRLLRQEGFDVHAADVFNNFKTKEWKCIKKMEMKDIRSARELYEASQLRIDGEYILDEAENLSSQILREWVMTNVVDDDKAVIIANTLKHPYRKSLARFETGNLFSYKFTGGNNININCNTWENTLQELSIMDSFISKSIHRAELSKISKWWNDIGLAKELKLARDQLLKWYTWSMAILSDMNLSDERIELTKFIALIYIIDDIFDLYGKPEELTLFTEEVNKWELEAVEQLPDYMKTSFRALYDIVNETAKKIAKKHGSNPDVYLQKAWASLCNAFLVEAKWFASKETPKAEEYLKNGIVSSGVHVVLVHSFFLLGLGGSTEEKAIISQDSSGIISSVATILRLWDDLGSAQDEDQDGHDGSYINYYMKEEQEEGVSVEMARKRVIKMISDEWKQLNRECLCLNRSSASFQKCALNFARMVPLMYDYDSHGNLPFLEQYIGSMFYDDICQPKGCSSIQIQREDPFFLL